MTTLNELAQLFGFSDNDQKDFHVWGKVVSVSGTKATVSLNASQVNVTCVKCEPCKAGDRVLVLIMSSGQAIIVGNATTRAILVRETRIVMVWHLIEGWNSHNIRAKQVFKFRRNAKRILRIIYGYAMS